MYYLDNTFPYDILLFVIHIWMDVSSGVTGGFMRNRSKKLIAAVCTAAMLVSTAVSNLQTVPVMAQISADRPAAIQEEDDTTGTGANESAASDTKEKVVLEANPTSSEDPTETGAGGKSEGSDASDANQQSSDTASSAADSKNQSAGTATSAADTINRTTVEEVEKADADEQSVPGKDGEPKTDEHDSADDVKSDTLTIHIHYQAADGGTVSSDGEEAVFTLAGEKPVLTGAHAAALPGYQFAGWTLDGTTVSEDADFVPDAEPDRYFNGAEEAFTETDLTYTANFRKEETKYPAVDFDRISFSDGSSVQVSAPEGAFPEGVRLSASQVNSSEVIDVAKKASGDDTLTEANIAAYDFDFYLDDTHGIEPLKDITVTVDGMAVEGSDQARDLSLYHLQNNDSPAEAVDASAITVSAVDEKTADITFKAADFSIYLAVRRAPAANGPFWINDITAVRYTTLKQAVEAAEEGNTIHMSGNMDASAVSGAVVGKNITLDVAADTTITGKGSSNGFTLASGSKLQTADGATLTMTGFGTALTVDTGAVMTDGTYVFTNVNTGINLKGAMSGSDQSKMHVTVTANKNAVGIDTTGSDVKYKNVTLIWNGGRQDGWTYRNMNAENSHIEIKDVWLYNSIDNPLKLNNCSFKISGRFNGSSWRGGHVLAVYEDGAEFNNSTVVVEGSRINVIDDKGLTINNSTVTVQNSPDGGFNVNYGSTLSVNDSRLIADHVQKAFIAAGYDSSSNVRITGSSVIEKRGGTSDTGVQGDFVVTGGSYDVSDGALDYQVPTNGEANGNEKLSLFTLSYPDDVNEIDMINKNGGHYKYPVKRANSNGQKRVWGPKASVVFRLNNGNATFADETTADKTGKTIRGNSLNFVKGNTDPGTPVSSDKFLGWYYKDEQGNEIPFTMGTAVNADIEVYAKWDNISVVYHNGEGQSYIQSAQPGQTKMAVSDYQDIVNRNSDFAVQGKTFEYWTTAADGSGKHYQKGDKIAFAEGQTQIDLYANYRKEQYTVSFSANGGTFSENSIYKNTQYFDIQKDKYGGEVAVLKQTAVYGQKLHDLTTALGLDYNLLIPDTAAKLAWNQMKDKTYWGTSAFGGDKIRFDDYKIWIISEKGENPVITGNVTYYLQWKPEAKRSDLSGSFNLPGDLWHDGISDQIKATTISKSVKTGDPISLTAGVDVTEVKERIGEIANVLNVGENEYSTIKINAPKCVLTASFEIPAGFSVSDKNQIKAEAAGLGTCFDLEEPEISGRTITVRFSLKSGMTDFEKLYEAVNSTGTSSGQLGNNAITLKISGLQVNGENVHDLDILTIKGAVSGNFTATAVKGEQTKAQAEQALAFDFTFSGKQVEGREDVKGSSGGITLSFRLNKPAQMDLPGDLTTEGANDSSAIRDVIPGESLTFVGRLDVSSIKDKIQYMQGAAEEHKIRNVTSKFVTTLHLGNGIIPESDLRRITLTDNSLFRISDAAVNGTDVTITMELLNTGYSSFKKLQTDVQAVPDILEIRVPAAVSGASSASGKILSIGTVTGEFHAEVVDDGDPELVLAEPSYTWHSEQSADADSKLGDGTNADPDALENTISYTVSVPGREKLPADILINDDTENASVYTAKSGEELTYKAKVDVTSVQQKMSGIESEFAVTTEEQFKNITLSDVRCEFLAEIIVPEELGNVWPKEKDSYSLENPDGTPASAFHITDVAVNGRTVTVRMSLTGFETGGNYAQLHKAVMEDTKNELVLKVHPFRVPDKIPRDQLITVYGAVNGAMRATAVKDNPSPLRKLARAAASSPQKVFAFAWESEQMNSGKDAAYPNAAASVISATFKVPASGTKQAETTGNNSGHSTTPSAPSTGADAVKTVQAPAAPVSVTSPAAPSKAQVPSAVSTGDSSHMILYLVLFAASAVCLVVWAVLHRTRRG